MKVYMEYKKKGCHFDGRPCEHENWGRDTCKDYEKKEPDEVTEDGVTIIRPWCKYDETANCVLAKEAKSFKLIRQTWGLAEIDGEEYPIDDIVLLKVNYEDGMGWVTEWDTREEDWGEGDELPDWMEADNTFPDEE